MKQTRLSRGGAASPELTAADARRRTEDLIKLRAAVDASGEVIFLTDRHGTFTYVNPEFSRLYGYARAEVVGKATPLLLEGGQRGPEHYGQFWQTLLAGQTVRAESVNRTKDGRLITVEVSASPVLNDAGEIIGFLSVERDVTRRRQEEERLRQRAQRLRLMVDNTVDYISLLTLSGVCTWISPSHRRLGYSESDLVGKPAADILDPDDRVRLVPRLARYARLKPTTLQALKRGAFAEEFSYRCIDKRGDWHHMEAHAVLADSPDAKELNVLVIARDVTERKRAELELQAQKELVERTLSSTPNSVLVIGRDGRVVLANSTYYRMFARRPGRIDGQKIEDIPALAGLAPAVAEALAGRASAPRIEFQHAVDGVTREYSAKIGSTQKQEVLLIIGDVTEERAKQEKLYRTHRLASVGEMTAGAAHELNNPLTSIIGLSQLLLQGDLPNDIRDDIATVHAEARRAAAIVRNLLTFARKQPSVKQLAQVNRVIEDVLKLRSYEHRTNHIAVEERLDADLPEMQIDAVQLQQVFLNIVLNAEDAMVDSHGGGRLTVTTQRVNGTIRIVFADDGPGIAPEHMPHIFDPFFTTKDVGKGTGLGLSIAHGIVANHGGRIWAESMPGQGATFFIDLPLGGDGDDQKADAGHDGAGGR